MQQIASYVSHTHIRCDLLQRERNTKKVKRKKWSSIVIVQHRKCWFHHISPCVEYNCITLMPLFVLFSPLLSSVEWDRRWTSKEIGFIRYLIGIVSCALGLHAFETFFFSSINKFMYFMIYIHTSAPSIVSGRACWPLTFLLACVSVLSSRSQA